MKIRKAMFCVFVVGLFMCTSSYAQKDTLIKHTLHSPSGGKVTATTDRKTMEDIVDMMNAGKANNEYILSLALNDNVLVIPNGTECILKEVAAFSSASQVLLTTGKYKGKRVWVRKETIK